MRSALLPVFALLTTSPAWTEPLAAVEGVGDERLRAAIERAVGERPEEAGTASSALRDARTAADRARRVLRSRGYYSALVEPALGENRDPLIRVNPGPQFTVGAVATEAAGDEAAREQAGEAIALQSGAPLFAQAVIDAEARGLLALQNHGWPDAEIGERLVVVDHESYQGRITFRYAPGPFSRYGAISRETGAWNPQFIARMSPLEPGAPASREEILTYQRRLDALDSVRAADITLGEPAADGSRPVLVELEAGPRHSIETGVSYSTSEGAGGNVRWTRRNMFGNDETLVLSSTLATLNQALHAELSRPHWRRYNQTLFLNAGLAHEDTDAYRQEKAEIGLAVTREDGLWQYGLGPQLDFSRIEDFLGERDVLTTSVDLVAGYDSRSDPLDPDDGIHATAQLTPAAVFGDCSCQYVRVELRGSGYQRISDSTVAALRMRLGSVVGASAAALPADQRFYAGGGGSARGFEYQSLSPEAPDGTPFGGTSVVELSAELRWRVRERWGVVGFVDSAMASSSNQPDFSNMRTAVGIGARYYFDFAPVRVDIATPLDRRDDEPAVQIYFSLGQAF